MCLSNLVGPSTGLSWQATRHGTSTLGGRILIYSIETTELETKVQNPYYTLQEELYRIVVAYKKPIIETLFHQTFTAQGQTLMRAYIYIYAHGAMRIKSL